MTELEDSEDIQSDNVNEQGDADKFDQLEKSIEESEKDFPIVESIGEMEESTPLEEDECDSIVESIEEGRSVDYDPIPDDFTENIKESLEEESQEITEVTKDTIGNKIEVIETSHSDINEDVLDISEEQTDETEFKSTLREEEAEVDIIAEKSSAIIATENTKEEEKISIFTLVLAAYVVYCILQVKLCQLFSLSA